MQPASRSARVRASAPRTGRSRPSRASSPNRPRCASSSDSKTPSAARMPTAMGRSSPAPPFRRLAGARFTVTLRPGNVRPMPEMAARTRVALSRTDASGSPTISTQGSCELIRTSTSTAKPSTPRRAPPRRRDMQGNRGTGVEGQKQTKAGPHRDGALPSTLEAAHQGAFTFRSVRRRPDVAAGAPRNPEKPEKIP